MTSKEDEGVIVVTGSSTATASPDRVSFTFGVNAVRETADEAATTTETVAKRALAEIQRLGIPENSIHTTSVEIDIKYERDYDQHSRVVGYRSTRSYTVKLQDDQMKLAEPAMRKLLNARVNMLGSLSWSLSDKAERALKLTAMNGAQEAARSKATLLASQLGYSLGKLINIQEGIERPIIIHRRARASARAESAAMADAPRAVSSMPIGSTMESASVTLTYELGSVIVNGSTKLPATMDAGTKFPRITPDTDPLYNWKSDSVVTSPSLPDHLQKLLSLPTVNP